MELNTKRKSTRGQIISLRINESVIFSKDDVLPSIVRATASSITTDNGVKYSVNVNHEQHEIKVTRIK